MKVSYDKDDTFKPVTITIVLEAREELKALNAITCDPESVAMVVKNNNPSADRDELLKVLKGIYWNTPTNGI